MNDTKNVRPDTGCLLVGGDFEKHTGNGVENSWLAAADPRTYLFREEDFGTNVFGSRFAVPAMRAKFPALLLDIPMRREDMRLRPTRGVAVLCLPPGSPWKEAVPLCVLGWRDDLVVMEDPDGMARETWREWDDQWFSRFLSAHVEEGRLQVWKLLADGCGKQRLFDAPFEAVQSAAA